MRKRSQVAVLCKDSADTVAARIKKGMGQEKALSVAGTLAKNLKEMEPGDICSHSTLEGVRKQERFWTQVTNILKKSK